MAPTASAATAKSLKAHCTQADGSKPPPDPDEHNEPKIEAIAPPSRLLRHSTRSSSNYSSSRGGSGRGGTRERFTHDGVPLSLNASLALSKKKRDEVNRKAKDREAFYDALGSDEDDEIMKEMMDLSNSDEQPAHHLTGEPSSDKGGNKRKQQTLKESLRTNNAKKERQTKLPHRNTNTHTPSTTDSTNTPNPSLTHEAPTTNRNNNPFQALADGDEEIDFTNETESNPDSDEHTTPPKTKTATKHMNRKKITFLDDDSDYDSEETIKQQKEKDRAKKQARQERRNNRKPKQHKKNRTRTTRTI
jgi:hypothetical protein